MFRFLMCVLVLLATVSSVSGAEVFEKRDPWIACGLSIILPGMGQHYNDDHVRGLLLNIAYIGGVTAVAVGEYEDDDTVGGIGALFAFPALIYSIIEAPMRSEQINKKLTLAPAAYRGLGNGMKLTLNF